MLAFSRAQVREVDQVAMDEYCVPGYSGRNAYIIHPPNFLEDIYSDSIFVRSEASPPTCSAIEDYRCLD